MGTIPHFHLRSRHFQFPIPLVLKLLRLCTYIRVYSPTLWHNVIYGAALYVALYNVDCVCLVLPHSYIKSGNVLSVMILYPDNLYQLVCHHL